MLCLLLILWMLIMKIRVRFLYLSLSQDSLCGSPQSNISNSAMLTLLRCNNASNQIITVVTEAPEDFHDIHKTQNPCDKDQSVSYDEEVFISSLEYSLIADLSIGLLTPLNTFIITSSSLSWLLWLFICDPGSQDKPRDVNMALGTLYTEHWNL